MNNRSWEELKQIKSCGVFFLSEAIFVVAAARTVPGFEIDSEPAFKLDRRTPPSKLGDVIVTALNSHRIDVLVPDTGSNQVSPLLEITGMKSWNELEHAATHVSIRLDQGIVRVIPTARDPRHGGYVHLPDQAFECADQPQDIGNTVLAMLERCS